MTRVLFATGFTMLIATIAWGAVPTVATQEGPGVLWSNVANALADDGASATATLTSVDSATQTLSLSDFGLSLPSDAVVAGLEATVEVSATGLSGSVPIVLQVQFKKPGGLNSNPMLIAVMDPSSGATFGPMLLTAGGETDLWNVTWTPAEINHADFALELRWDKAGPDASGTIEIDFATIEVTYASPSMGAGVITASRPGPYYVEENLELYAPAGTDYQWLRDGEHINSANGASLEFTSLQMNDTGDYSVLFTTVTKELAVADPFALVVLPAPNLPAARLVVLVILAACVGWFGLRHAQRA